MMLKPGFASESILVPTLRPLKLLVREGVLERLKVTRRGRNRIDVEERVGDAPVAVRTSSEAFE